MPFNPCGYRVEYIRQEGVDYIRPFRDSDIVVRRRWYRVPETAPPLPFPTIFRPTNIEPFPYLREGAGSVWPAEWEAKRIGELQGFDYTHFCGTKEDFQRGAVFDPLLNVQYDADWIPDCCGRDDMCTFNLCAQEQEHARPASQLRTYPIPHQDATDTTPVLIEHAGLNLGDHSPAWPGIGWEWKPGGELVDPVRQFQVIADENGDLQFQTDVWTFAVGSIARTINATGYGLDFDLAGDVGGMALEFVGGLLTLTGTNLQVAKSILPPDTSYLNSDVIFGTSLITVPLAQIPPGVHWVNGTTSTTRFFQLVAADGAVCDVIPNVLHGAVIFPPTGEAFYGLAANASISIINTTAVPTFGWRLTRSIEPSTGLGFWGVEKYNLRGVITDGTVSAVGISTSSTGLTVGVTDPTTTPALTVNLDTAIQDVVAVASVDGIIAGDGAGGLLTISIGDWLTYAGGVLDVVPPTATNGHKLCSTFAVTAATGVFQATGDTFTLPTAGTYLITGRIRAGLQGANLILSRMEAKLRDTTAGADVTDSTAMIVRNIVSSQTFESTAGFSAIHTVTGASVIELYAARVGTTWTFSSILSDADGQTTFDWVRLF